MKLSDSNGVYSTTTLTGGLPLVQETRGDSIWNRSCQLDRDLPLLVVKAISFVVDT